MSEAYLTKLQIAAGWSDGKLSQALGYTGKNGARDMASVIDGRNKRGISIFDAIRVVTAELETRGIPVPPTPEDEKAAAMAEKAQKAAAAQPAAAPASPPKKAAIAMTTTDCERGLKELTSACLDGGMTPMELIAVLSAETARLSKEAVAATQK
jgi:hypothetical protein